MYKTTYTYISQNLIKANVNFTKNICLSSSITHTQKKKILINLIILVIILLKYQTYNEQLKFSLVDTMIEYSHIVI